MILKTNSYTIGKISEQYVISYLKKLQWDIISTNYKTPYGEIDVIATYNTTLVACEIKARKSKELLHYSIKRKQQLRIANALLNFLASRAKYNNYTIRFDAILIEIPNNKIVHIKNAWEINE